MANWFTSDHHFGHANIVDYCKRPFEGVADHDRELYRRWQCCVRPGDVVYYIGDFSFLSPPFTADLCSRLDGEKHLIKGNHDRSHRKMVEAGFKTSQLTLWLPDQKWFLIHDPAQLGLGTLGKLCPSAILCGHLHEKKRLWWWEGGIYGKIPVINVGVDQWDFYPLLETEVQRELEDFTQSEIGPTVVDNPVVPSYTKEANANDA